MIISKENQNEINKKQKTKLNDKIEREKKL